MAGMCSMRAVEMLGQEGCVGAASTVSSTHVCGSVIASKVGSQFAAHTSWRVRASAACDGAACSAEDAVVCTQTASTHSEEKLRRSGRPAAARTTPSCPWELLQLH